MKVQGEKFVPGVVCELSELVLGGDLDDRHSGSGDVSI
jgi:hypothetical protein